MAFPENKTPIQLYQVACTGLIEFANFNYNNRSLLLRTQTVASLEPSTSNQEGNITLTDTNIGTLALGFRGDTAGTYDVTSLELTDELYDTDFAVEAVAMEITLNETVITGETLTGSFAGNFMDSDGATHSLSGNFRVIKDN